MNPTEQKEAVQAALAAPKGTPVLIFNLKKASLSRTFHVDGAWFGFDPAGRVRFSFYTDTKPIPDTVKMLTDGKGGLEMDIPNLPMNLVNREIEVEISMTPDTALQFYQGLQDNLKNIGKLTT